MYDATGNFIICHMFTLPHVHKVLLGTEKDRTKIQFVKTPIYSSKSDILAT